MSSDLITREVVGGYLIAAAREMHVALIRTAYSLNVKERQDCSCSILDAQGRTVSLGLDIPLHLGSMLGLVEAILQRFDPSEIRPGDVFLTNDPYSGGGSHLPDFTMAAPVFAGGQLIAFAANIAHHSDIGGSRAGSLAADNTSIFQEGLRLPPVKIHREGVLQQDIVEVILLNSRVPEERRGDLGAQFASTHIGVRRIEELCQRYSPRVVVQSMEELMQYSERRIRTRITAIPDGVYDNVDELDDETLAKPIKLALRLTVQGDSLQLDFTGSDRQVPSPKNVPTSALLATIYTVVMQMVDPGIPPNAGLYRAIQVTAPPGTVVNPVSPAAVGDRALTCNLIGDLVAIALSAALPERALAGSGPYLGTTTSGINPQSARFFVNFEAFAGSEGATAERDGQDAVRVYASGGANQSVEAMELAFPVQVERYEFLCDTGGAGRRRGGLATRRDIRTWGGELSLSASGGRYQMGAPSLFGGQPGSRAGVTVNPGGAGEQRLGVNFSGLSLQSGDVVSVLMASGAGFGNPLERDPEQVLADVREERVSVRGAARDYGVEIDDGRVNAEKTAALRRSRLGS